MKNLLSKNNEKILKIVCFAIFGVFLYMQHRYIGLYYDDFGNASLSYGYDSSNIIGTDYSITDLVKWAISIYMNWSGRVIYAVMFLIPLTKNGADLFMLVQTCIIIAIFLLVFLLTKMYSKKDLNISSVIICLVIYLSLNGDIVRYGLYWASASVLYLWPVLPFFLFLVMQKKYHEKEENGAKIHFWNYIIIAIVISFIVLSQEQIGGAFVVYCCIILFIDFKRKHIVKIDIFSLIMGIINFVLFMAAPGNWVRLATNEPFSNMNIFEKITYNFPHIIGLMTSKELLVFNLVLVCAGVLMIVGLYRGKRKNAFFFLHLFFLLPCLVDILVKDLSLALNAFFFVIFMLNMFVLICRFFIYYHQEEMIALFVAAVASVFCLVISPSLQMRSLIPYVFCYMLLPSLTINNLIDINLSESVEHHISDSIIIAIVSIILLIPSIINGIQIYKGYEKNYYMVKLNDEILSSYNGIDSHIFLLTYDNCLYRAQMPCDMGYDYINTWMKEYYNIPSDVNFIWKSMDDYINIAKSNVIDVTYGEGFYDDEGGWRWTTNNAVLGVIAQEQVTASLSFDVSSGYDDNSNLMIYVNDKLVNTFVINSETTYISCNVDLMNGKNIIQISTDAQQRESGSDMRLLYLMVSNLNISKIN